MNRTGPIELMVGWRKARAMGGETSSALARDPGGSMRRQELLTFLILAVVIWPFIAVGVVAGWGFVVWMYYILTGPPGPV